MSFNVQYHGHLCQDGRVRGTRTIFGKHSLTVKTTDFVVDSIPDAVQQLAQVGFVVANAWEEGDAIMVGFDVDQDVFEKDAKVPSTHRKGYVLCGILKDMQEVGHWPLPANH